MTTSDKPQTDGTPEPPTTPRSVRMPPDLWRKLDYLATKKGVPPSTFLRQMAEHITKDIPDIPE